MLSVLIKNLKTAVSRYSRRIKTTRSDYAIDHGQTIVGSDEIKITNHLSIRISGCFSISASAPIADCSNYRSKFDLNAWKAFICNRFDSGSPKNVF